MDIGLDTEALCEHELRPVLVFQCYQEGWGLYQNNNKVYYQTRHHDKGASLKSENNV